MTERAGTPTERILRLAAYARERTRDRSPITLNGITVDVPGFETDAERDPSGDLVPDTKGWEAVRKRLQRDLDDLLVHWGIALVFDPADGEYRLDTPFFTAGERRAVIAAAATVEVEGVEPAIPGALGSAVDDASAQIVIRVHSLVAALRTAIGTRTPVTFTYDGVTRRVEPYAIGTWRDRWYLAARDVEHGQLRRFRLDRIVDDDGDVEHTIAADGAPGAYTVPDDFDADAAFDLDPNSWGHDPLVRARVRVGRDHVAAFLAELGGAVVTDDGSSADVELDVREYTSFRRRLLAFRGNAVVVGPPELVAVVRDHLAAVAGAV